MSSAIESAKETAQQAVESVKGVVESVSGGGGGGGGHVASSSGSSGGPSNPATRQEMSDARLPLAYRDACAHLLIPLNKCRYQNYYMPFRCEEERHSYEKCQYEEFKLRVKKMDEIRAQKGGARSN